MDHKHSRDGDPGCLGCKIKSIALTIPYRDQFHNTTLAAQERAIREKHPNAERLK